MNLGTSVLFLLLQTKQNTFNFQENHFLSWYGAVCLSPGLEILTSPTSRNSKLLVQSNKGAYFLWPLHAYEHCTRLDLQAPRKENCLHFIKKYLLSQAVVAHAWSTE